MEEEQQQQQQQQLLPHIEREYSIKIPLQYSEYTDLKRKLTLLVGGGGGSDGDDVGVLTTIKKIYNIDNDQIYYRENCMILKDQIIKQPFQRKQLLMDRVCFLQFHNDLLPYRYTCCLEQKWSKTKNHIHTSTVYRTSVFVNKLRIAVEEKMYMNKNITLFFFHIECENNVQLCDKTTADFVNALYTTGLVQLFSTLTFCNRNYNYISINTILSLIQQYNFTRNYTEKKIARSNTWSSPYYAVKLDGTRYLILFTYDTFYIFNHVPLIIGHHPFKFKFNYIAQVECIDTTFYIIDLLYILTIDNLEKILHFKIHNVHDAITFINGLNINDDSIRSDDGIYIVKKNIYNKNLGKIIEIKNNFANDGLLQLYRHCIVKIKHCITIDLKIFLIDWFNLLLKRKLLNDQEISIVQQYKRAKRPLTVQDIDTKNFHKNINFTKSLWKCYNVKNKKYILFHTHFKNCKILWPLKNLSLDTLWRRDADVLLQNFTIVEFTHVFFKNKHYLIFRRTRYDKANCNTLSYIENIIQ
nr:hypothetical protein [Microctonus hyperodae filamentous virus]